MSRYGPQHWWPADSPATAFVEPSGDLNLDGKIDSRDVELFDWVVACDVVRETIG